MSATLIIIPIYNGEEFIERTLKSCVTQTVSTEVWVVDNCSTDKTQGIVKKWIEQYPSIRLVINEKNLGRIGNWNRCLELFENSKFDYIKFLFAGDELFSNCVEECEKALGIDPEIGALAFHYEFAHTDGQVSVSDYPCDYDNKLFNVKEVTQYNIEKGGILGAIIADVYKKKFIQGYRFSEFFIGKSDFDYEILSRSKGYYLGKTLGRFNLDCHRTFYKALDYITETEYIFNRAYRLEKTKQMFTPQEYAHMREWLFLEFVLRNENYYPLETFLKLWFFTSKIIIRKILRYFKKIIKKVYGK